QPLGLDLDPADLAEARAEEGDPQAAFIPRRTPGQQRTACSGQCAPDRPRRDRATVKKMRRRGREPRAAMVNPVLERLYQANVVTHRDGRQKPLCPPGMTPEQGEYLFALIRALRPSLTLEIGFAYGLSTLFIAEGLRQNGSGHHLTIDPNERERFDGLGL